MRIVIDMGHTPTSPGASGYLDELTCDREAGKRIIAELKRRGHTVYNSTPPDNVSYPNEINQRCSYTNSLSNIDLFVSLHLNAGGGYGTEVLYYYADTTGKKYATQLSKNVSKALDIKNRGTKSNDWVGVICNTNPTSVLIEFCFVDSKGDADAWHACPWDDLVSAVCDGIEMKDWTKPAPKPEPTPTPEPEPEDKDMEELKKAVDKLTDIVTDGNDYSGRGKDGATVFYRVPWMAAKQEEMQKSIDELNAKVDAIYEILKEA